MLLILTTYPNNARQLRKFITKLVQSGIAACVQRINYVKSFYVRENSLKKEEEKILLIKIAPEKKEQLEIFFKKNHPYKIPEIIFLKPESLNQAYLERVAQAEGVKKEKKVKGTA